MRLGCALYGGGILVLVLALGYLVGYLAGIRGGGPRFRR